MDMNFNKVVEDSGQDYSPMPEKTVVRCLMTIEPGGIGEGGYYCLSQKQQEQLIVKFTVLTGQYAGKFFKDWLHCDERNGAHQITRRYIRDMIEEVFDIEPGDNSESAMAKRHIQSIGELDKKEICVSVKIDGTFNKIGFIVNKNNPSYIPKTGVAQHAPVSAPVPPQPVMAQPTPAPQASASPSWAPNV